MKRGLDVGTTIKKVTKWHILSIGLVILSLAGVFLWWGLSYVNTTFEKFLIVIASLLLVLVSSIFFILFAISFEKSHNVFLYDKKIKKNILLENLTFERVCEFLDIYLGLVFHGRKSLVVEDVFNSDLLKDVPKEYYPLIQIRVLLIWIEMDSDNKWKQFAFAEKVYIDTMEEALFNYGEKLISSKIQYLWASYTGDNTEIKDFFCNNIDYLKEFILNYVKANIHSFD